MKEMFVRSFRHLYEFPAKIEPFWATAVDRWNRLDAAAFGLVDFYFTVKDEIGPPPQQIVLTSPQASNETDFAFAQGGLNENHWSPGRFVHTLPSVRLSPLCQAMQWTGPTIYLQQGESSLICALQEAAWHFELPHASEDPLWVIDQNASNNSINAFVLNSSPETSQAFKIKLRLDARSLLSHKVPSTDHQLLQWIAQMDSTRSFEWSSSFDLTDDCRFEKI